MTRARPFVLFAVGSLALWYLVPGCGGQQALDVTAPDDSNSSADWGEEDEPSGKGKKGDQAAEAEAWTPCLEKQCGTPCTSCNPADENCEEIQILKQCNPQGECVMAPADCTVPEEEAEKK